MEKLGQCNKMFEKLQEWQIKRFQKYTLAYLLRTVTINKGMRANKNKMCKQRQNNTCTRGNIPHLEAKKEHINNLSNKILREDQINN